MIKVDVYRLNYRMGQLKGVVEPERVVLPAHVTNVWNLLVVEPVQWVRDEPIV